MNFNNIDADFHDYNKLFEEDEEYEISERTIISTKWWDENSNDISNWTMQQIDMMTMIYKDIKFYKNKIGENLLGSDIATVLRSIDRVLLNKIYF
jgi:hypothetical protein